MSASRSSPSSSPMLSLTVVSSTPMARRSSSLKRPRQKGLKILANWHSHPASPSRPSQEDLRLANDPTIRYAILSLLGDKPNLNSFRILGGEVADKEVHLATE